MLAGATSVIFGGLTSEQFIADQFSQDGIITEIRYLYFFRAILITVGVVLLLLARLRTRALQNAFLSIVALGVCGIWMEAAGHGAR